VSEHEFGVSLPLDSDGFLRRECPTCEREFKWLHSEAEDADDDAEQGVLAGGYFCPYCAVQSPDGSWWTKPQLELVEAVAAREVLGPELERLARSADEVGRSSGGLIEANKRRVLGTYGGETVIYGSHRRIDARRAWRWRGAAPVLVSGTSVALSERQIVSARSWPGRASHA
jgi:hypothetical protein